jgi:hypothetical protein
MPLANQPLAQDCQSVAPLDCPARNLSRLEVVQFLTALFAGVYGMSL